MAVNEFFNGKVLAVNFTLPTASTGSTVVPSGYFIPQGAIITGVTLNHTATIGANNTAASATVNLGIVGGGSSVSFASTKVISSFAAQNTPYNIPLVSSAGVYVPQTGELQLSIGASTNNTTNYFVPTVYVGYVL